MGASASSRVSADVATPQSAFKLFEYQCTNCKAKRPIQYFHRNGKFLPQKPRVVCGECNTSMSVQPFKTVDYRCPACKKCQKARLPAKPIPLNMYNVSLVVCSCGFKGEVGVGRQMDIACSHCWRSRREIVDVWTEDGDEFKTYCDSCTEHSLFYATLPKKRGSENTDMEYCCENCFRVRPIRTAELLQNEGLACCSLCNWVGYPEVHPQGHFEKPKKTKEDPSSRSVPSTAASSHRSPAAVAQAPPSGATSSAWAETAEVKRGGSNDRLQRGQKARTAPEPDSLSSVLPREP